MDISWSMNQDAVFSLLTDRDGYNRPTFALDVPLTAAAGSGVRWQFKQKMIRTSNGQEVMSEAEVWLPLSIETIKVDDQLEYKGKKYQIIGCSKKVDIHGQDCFWKVFCITQV